MNTLSKVLAVFCVLLSALVFAQWEKVDGSPHPATFPGDTSSLATSADGKIVYFCKDHHLFKSIDGGETWTVLR